MVLRRSGNFYPISQLRDELDRRFTSLWDNLSNAAPGVVPTRAFPAVNVWELGDELYAEAEVPGVSSADLDISVVGSELTIRGERKETPQASAEGATFHRRERGLGSFTRVIRLPVEVDSSRVQAELKEGVLLITLPKHEAAKPRKIQVNAAG